MCKIKLNVHITIINILCLICFLITFSSSFVTDPNFDKATYLDNYCLKPNFVFLYSLYLFDLLVKFGNQSSGLNKFSFLITWIIALFIFINSRNNIIIHVCIYLVAVREWRGCFAIKQMLYFCFILYILSYKSLEQSRI